MKPPNNASNTFVAYLLLTMHLLPIVDDPVALRVYRKTRCIRPGGRTSRHPAGAGSVRPPHPWPVGGVSGGNRRTSAVQWTVEDEAVALVVVDDAAALVRVVVRGLHDASAIRVDGLCCGVDVSGLDADDDLPGHGVVHRCRERDGDRPPVDGRIVGSIAELERHPQGLRVEADRLVEVVRRQDDHPYVVVAHRSLPLAA